jgi:hypothetical protein
MLSPGVLWRGLRAAYFECPKCGGHQLYPTPGQGLVNAVGLERLHCTSCRCNLLLRRGLPPRRIQASDAAESEMLPTRPPVHSDVSGELRKLDRRIAEAMKATAAERREASLGDLDDFLKPARPAQAGRRG